MASVIRRFMGETVNPTERTAHLSVSLGGSNPTTEQKLLWATGFVGCSAPVVPVMGNTVASWKRLGRRCENHSLLGIRLDSVESVRYRSTGRTGDERSAHTEHR